MESKPGDLPGTAVGGAVADGTAVTCGVRTGTYVGPPPVALKNKTAPATTSTPPASVNQRDRRRSASICQTCASASSHRI